ncbi:MAG TPA: OsmC family protein [Streptosporangiaceae bacterium]
MGRERTADVVSVSVAGYEARVTVRGHELTVDEPAEDGGKDTGPTPTELLLASLASCYTLALRWAAKHRNLPLGDVQVTASGSYDGLKFGAIRLNVAGDLPPGQEAVLLRDASRVCYVSNTLAASVPVEITLDPA